MKIVTAIDSFKGSMTSMEAGRAVAEGIHRACLLYTSDAADD